MSTYFFSTCKLLFTLGVSYSTHFCFSFIFTLQEFAGELMSLTDAMRRIYAFEQVRADSPNWLRRYIVHGPSLLMAAVRLRRRNLTREKSSRRRFCR